MAAIINLFISHPEATEKAGWTRLKLAAPRIIQELQATDERAFPGCHTQTVFIKGVGASRYETSRFRKAAKEEQELSSCGVATIFSWPSRL